MATGSKQEERGHVEDEENNRHHFASPSEGPVFKKGGMYMRDLLEQCLAPFPSLCTDTSPQLPKMLQG